MLFAPLDGWRRVEVRERRTKVDWAHVIKKLVDEDYPDRDRIVLVMDNLNTHKLSSLYEAFEPAEARRIAERLEIHYTPKHGSWLNMAEIEIGVLARQCLDRRIANQDILRGEVNAWQNQRNRDVIRVDWRFTTEDARIKLKSLYPSIQNVEPLARQGLLRQGLGRDRRSRRTRATVPGLIGLPIGHARGEHRLHRRYPTLCSCPSKSDRGRVSAGLTAQALTGERANWPMGP